MINETVKAVPNKQVNIDEKLDQINRELIKIQREIDLKFGTKNMNFFSQNLYGGEMNNGLMQATVEVVSKSIENVISKVNADMDKIR